MYKESNYTTENAVGLNEKMLFTYVFMWNDMWDVLQQKLCPFLAFFQLLKQQTGLQVPECNNKCILTFPSVLLACSIYQQANLCFSVYIYLRSQWSSGVNLRLQSRS